MMLPFLYAGLLAAVLTGLQDEGANAQRQSDEDRERQRSLRSLSIQELMNLEVYTPSRREESLFRTPAAVTVIRGEDIRRMGVTSLPDALRAVPGAQVGRIDGSTWAVSMRGFNSQFANKLQVLVDGRSVYSDLFSGVYWDILDTNLADIDRIEVIRGPGASQWGANAVNGVINIITRDASKTQGGRITAGFGTEELGFASARYGGAVGEKGHYRVFAKHLVRDEQHRGDDASTQGRGGAAFEWGAGEQDTYHVAGEYYDGTEHHLRTLTRLIPPFPSTFVDREELSGGHLVARWRRRISDESHLQIQFNAAHAQRTSEFLDQQRETVSVDLSHQFPILEGHEFVWGAEASATTDELDGTFTLSFDPDEDTQGRVGVFLQDQVELLSDTISLMVGSKFEYNSHSHYEYQPTVKIHARPSSGQAAWASVSRAVRTPSRADDAIMASFLVIPSPTPSVYTITGERDLDSEDLLAYEVGYRLQPAESISLDLVAFRNEYDDLATAVVGVPYPRSLPPPPHTVVPFERSNALEGVTYGIEASITWDVAPWWRLNGVYSLLRMHLDEKQDGVSLAGDDDIEGRSPRNSVFLRSSWDILEVFELDAMVRYVDVLPTDNVESYGDLDLRLAWHPADDLEISIIGRNLLHDEHFEFGPGTDSTAATEVERSVLLMVGKRF